MKRFFHSRKFKILLVLLIPALILVGLYHDRHDFSVERWNEQPFERYLIVRDLESEYGLVGMTAAEVEALLGEAIPVSEFQGEWPNTGPRWADNLPDNTMVYSLGAEYLDTIYLILPVEDGIVTDIHYDLY